MFVEKIGVGPGLREQTRLTKGHCLYFISSSDLLFERVRPSPAVPSGAPALAELQVRSYSVLSTQYSVRAPAVTSPSRANAFHECLLQTWFPSVWHVRLI